MTWWQLLVLAESVVVLALLAHWLRIGFQRRRPFWVRGSWLRFGAVCATGFVLWLVPVGTEAAIDFGLITRIGLSADARSLWALTDLAAMVLGGVLFIGCIGWFALGDPTRQFPGAPDGQSTADTSDAGSA